MYVDEILFLSSLEEKGMHEPHIKPRKRLRGVNFPESFKVELRKYYDSYNSLTPKEKLFAAAKLDLPLSSFRAWMRKKQKKQKRMEEERAKILTSFKQEETMNSTGINKLVSCTCLQVENVK